MIDLYISMCDNLRCDITYENIITLDYLQDELDRIRIFDLKEYELVVKATELLQSYGILSIRVLLNFEDCNVNILALYCNELMLDWYNDYRSNFIPFGDIILVQCDIITNFEYAEVIFKNPGLEIQTKLVFKDIEEFYLYVNLYDELSVSSLEDRLLNISFVNVKNVILQNMVIINFPLFALKRIKHLLDILYTVFVNYTLKLVFLDLDVEVFDGMLDTIVRLVNNVSHLNNLEIQVPFVFMQKYVITKLSKHEKLFNKITNEDIKESNYWPPKVLQSCRIYDRIKLSYVTY